MISPYVLPGLIGSMLTEREGALDDILERCCFAAGVSLEEVKTPSRKRALNIARQLYCWKAKTTTSYTLESIGALICRDHASVVYAYKQALLLVETRDQAFTEALNRL